MASVRVQGFSTPNTIMVNVWFRSHHTSYQLPLSSTVGELRRRVAADHNVSPAEMKIILGGHLLDDDLTIQASGVGMESTLFAVQRKLSPTSSASSSTSTTTPTTVPTTAAAATTPGGSQGQLLDQYYVYCKVCQQVRAGRLRVKCSVCEGGAVLLDKGPGSWEDVLMAGRLTGTCQTLHCDGCQPIFYFKCAEQHSGIVGSTVVPLHHIMPNRRCVPCITCEDVMNPVVVFPCECSHVMCLGCFGTYCSVRLKERGFQHTAQYGYTLSCPAGCAESYIQEQHHFCMLGGGEYERYKDFAAEECLLSEGGLFCPRQECASGFILDTVDRHITCPYCQFVFCRHCRREKHEGICNPATTATPRPQDFSDAERARRARWEEQSADTIQQTTKACPGCQTRTERDGGCMHMHCARCGEQWCWLCVKTWDRECQAAHWFC